MNCPLCDCSEIRAASTRHDTVESIIRDRRCTQCDYKWYTCEIDIPRDAVRWGTNSVMRRLPGYRKITFQ